MNETKLCQNCLLDMNGICKECFEVLVENTKCEDCKKLLEKIKVLEDKLDSVKDFCINNIVYMEI